MALLDELDARRERTNQDDENSARLAQCYALFTSTGLGSYQHPGRIAFDVTFIEKPFVSYAAAVDPEDLSDAVGFGGSDEVPLPHCTGYVTGWDQDERDLYIGCWVSVRVHYSDTDGVEADVQPEIEHHFTFAGIAMKDIPTDATDRISS